MSKIPKPITKKTPRRKIEIFDFYEHVIEMKQKPISIRAIERLARDLMKWAMEDENATKMRPFFNSRGIYGNDIKRWRGRSDDFDRAYKLALAVIGDRREHGALTRKYSERTVLVSMHHYDDDWKSIDKWQSDLKKNEQEQKVTTFNVSMPSFSEKKDKENDKKQKVEMFLLGKIFIDKESVESLRFFETKYKGLSLFSQKTRAALRPELVRASTAIFTNPRLLSYIQAMKDVREGICCKTANDRVRLASVCSFLDIIDRLECFYDLNKGTAEHGIKDKRIHVFVTLKADVLRVIRFLEKRTGNPKILVNKTKKGIL